jgi:hypothetical protein
MIWYTDCNLLGCEQYLTGSYRRFAGNYLQDYTVWQHISLQPVISSQSETSNFIHDLKFSRNHEFRFMSTCFTSALKIGAACSWCITHYCTALLRRPLSAQIPHLGQKGVTQSLWCLTTGCTTGVQSPAKTKDFSSSVCVKVRSQTHPASCPMGTGSSFLGVKRGRGVRLATHPTYCWGQEWGAITFHPLAPAWRNGTALPFNFSCPR